MKQINGVNYKDYKDCLNYLNENDTIGNELADYNGIFHIHWRGPIDNDKVIFQIKSTLATQQVSKIYFWIENNLTTMLSPGYTKLMQFGKYVEVKVFNEEVFMQVKGDPINKKKIWEYYQRNMGDMRYRTDMLRWIILSIYGGIYSDADTLMLRDLRNIHLKNWSCTWAQDDYAEACVLKLEKGSDVYEQMYLNEPNDPRCFLLMMANDKPYAYSYDHKNLKFTNLPCPFFDIIWGHEHCQNGERGVELNKIKMKTFDDFWVKTNIDVKLEDFMKPCFTFHWHNRWNVPELKDSIAGRLNQDIDRIINEKYNINPIKIFNE